MLKRSPTPSLRRSGSLGYPGLRLATAEKFEYLFLSLRQNLLIPVASLLLGELRNHGAFAPVNDWWRLSTRGSNEETYARLPLMLGGRCPWTAIKRIHRQHPRNRGSPQKIRKTLS